MTLPQNGGGTTPPKTPPLMNDAAAKPQVPRDLLTDQRQERARLAVQDDAYVARAHRRPADPIVRRYRRLLREVA